MAANEVGGLVVPVRVVGGGVTHGTVGVGVVGVDEVEARASLLMPTLEQGYPAHPSPTTTTVTWRLVSRATQHLEGIYVLACERGTGLVFPRVHQQLQAHDISLRHHNHHHHTRRHSSLLQQTTTTSLSTTDNSEHMERSRTMTSDVVTRMQAHNSTIEEEEKNEVEEEKDEDDEVGSERRPPQRAPPQCSKLRVLGHTSYPGKLSHQVQGLLPYTSYWLLLLPHYKGVLGVPSNLQPFTTPQDVPSGWAVLSRWWAARVESGLYALTLHWSPISPRHAHGVILKYLITVKESDTGVTHNVSVLGDVTTLTLPNVTSSRVEVTLMASTIMGYGPSSPPARLNLLRTHLKEPGMGVVRSAWFLVLTGGAVAMVVVVVACTLAARWCVTGMHHQMPSEVSKGKVLSVGGPWVDVGGLWAPGPSHHSSDKSERKLLASSGSPLAAEYFQAEAVTSHLKDDLPTKTRLAESWPSDYLSPSPSPSSASCQRAQHHTQSESMSAPRAGRVQAGGAIKFQRHTGTCYTSAALRTSCSSWQETEDSTWYSGECCSCCHNDINLPPRESSGTASGCSTVLQANLNRSDLQAFSSTLEYQYSGLSTDAYEVVSAYEEASAITDSGPDQPSKRLPALPLRRDLQHLTLNTESNTDLSLSCYNFDDDDDITQSCSDTEASFFIPHDMKRQQKEGDMKDNNSVRDKRQGHISSFYSSHTSGEVSCPKELRKLEQSHRDGQSSTSSLKCPDQSVESSSTSTSGASTLNPLTVEDLETSSTRRVSCHSSLTQDSLEEQFERTLNMITHGGSANLD
nr:uncharacterized protein LOC128684451 [Cherax quadricarinatus]